MSSELEAKTHQLIDDASPATVSMIPPESNTEEPKVVVGQLEARSSRYLHKFEKETEEDEYGVSVPSYFALPGQCKTVFFECKIKRMSDIDTIQETFRCRFHIYLTWLATREESDKYQECVKSGRQYKPNWVPDLKYMNAVELYEVKQWEQGRYKVIKGWKHQAMKEETWNVDPNVMGFEPWYGNWNRIKMDFDILFAEEFELPGFPFDCQDISLHVQIDCPIGKADLLPFPRSKCFLLFSNEFRTSEWFYENIICEFKKSEKEESKRRIQYPKIEIHIKASRRWYVHVGQIIVTFCMFTLGLCTFVMNLDNEEGIGSRLGYSVTLILADVATVQLVFQNTQFIGYWTILDYYIYSCFTFLYFVIIWSAIAVALIDVENVSDVDDIVFWVFAGACFLVHLYFGTQMLRVYRMERTKLAMTSLELEDYFEGTVAYDEQYAIAVMGTPTKFLQEGYHKYSEREDGFNIYAKGEKARSSIS